MTAKATVLHTTPGIVPTSPGLRDVDCASFRAHMLRRSRALLPLAVMTWLFGLAASVSAQTSAPPKAPAVPSAPVAIDPLVAIVDADPLELSRVVQHLGDRPVIDRLAPKRGIEQRLAAIRATPYLKQPELALAALCPIVIERDGVLAQAAARAVWLIVTALSRDSLERHENAVADLAKVTQEITRIAGLPHLRADLRSQMNAAAAMLTGLNPSAAD